MYDIRQISNHRPNIHSRYYIDTNGIVYTSLAENTNKIIIDEKRRSLVSFKQNNICNLNCSDKQLIVIPNTDNKYYLMYNGKILQRLKTRTNFSNSQKNCMDEKKKQVTVGIIRINGNGSADNEYVSRLVASCFLGNVSNKEVHHIDGNRLNNKVTNLSIVTKEEHINVHKLESNDYLEREYT